MMYDAFQTQVSFHSMWQTGLEGVLSDLRKVSCVIRTKMQERLVIEGKIDGTTYYWPLTAGGEMGIERNMTYNYNILIRRKGTTDPDTPVEPKDIDIELNIKTWTEKENYQVRF